MKLLVKRNGQLNLFGIVKLSLIVSFLFAFFLKGTINLSRTIDINVVPIMMIVFSIAFIVSITETTKELFVSLNTFIRKIVLSYVINIYKEVTISIINYIEYVTDYIHNIYQKNNVIRC